MNIKTNSNTTTEEKAKAYDEAFEKAKKKYDSKYHHGEGPSGVYLNNADLEEIFPALKESEDEMIRKEIVKFIKDNTLTYTQSGCESQNRWIDYLENLKEKKDYRKLYEDITKSEWFKKNYVGKSLGENSYDFAMSRQEMQQEQRWMPTENEMGVLYKLCYVSNQISDDDDTELTHLYQDLKREYFNGHSFENMFSKTEIEKKLAEWSEEDEKIWKDIFELCNRFGYDDACRLLKSSLHPQQHWKPSKEQMVALKDVVETYRVRHNASVGGDSIFMRIQSLYHDLQKLL